MVFKLFTMKKLLYSVLLISFFACAPSSNKKQKSTEENAKVVTYYIAPYKVSCVGVAPMQCLLTKTTPTDNWEYFYATIKGFKHEPGMEYTIKVKETPVKDAPADASSIEYELVEIIDSKAYTPPAIHLHDIWGVVELNGINPLSQDCEQTLELNLNELTVLGKAGCNDFRGQFKTADGTNAITFENLISTRKTCPNQALEDTYLQTLESIDSYFRFNQNLFLIANQDAVIKLRRMD